MNRGSSSPNAIFTIAQLAPHVRARSRRQAIGCQRSWARYRAVIRYSMKKMEDEDVGKSLTVHNCFK